MSNHALLGLEDPVPSSPHKPGKHSVRCYCPNFMTFSWRTTYAARKSIDDIIKDQSWKLVNDHEMITDDGKNRFESETIKEIMNYKLNAKEKQWDSGEPHNGYMRVAIFGKGAEAEARSIAKTGAPRPQPKPKVERPDGLISLQSICEEIGIEPRDARAILRRKKIDKPEHGRWEWEQGEIDRIKKVLKA